LPKEKATGRMLSFSLPHSTPCNQTRRYQQTKDIHSDKAAARESFTTLLGFRSKKGRTWIERQSLSN
jgi:hypothetical protein